MTNELAHYYNLGEAAFILRDSRSDFKFSYEFFVEISLSIQNSPRWDATFCDITYGAIQFAYVPKMGHEA